MILLFKKLEYYGDSCLMFLILISLLIFHARRFAGSTSSKTQQKDGRHKPTIFFTVFLISYRFKGKAALAGVLFYH